MSESVFVMTIPSRGDKKIEICGPRGLVVYVDYDDVDAKSVMKDTENMIRILNKHWASEAK